MVEHPANINASLPVLQNAHHFPSSQHRGSSTPTAEECACVRICVCMCVCVFMYVCMCMCVFMCAFTYMCIHVCVCVYLRVFALCICVCMCAFVRAFLCACACAWMQVHVCACWGGFWPRSIPTPHSLRLSLSGRVCVGNRWLSSLSLVPSADKVSFRPARAPVTTWILLHGVSAHLPDASCGLWVGVSLKTDPGSTGSSSARH